VLARVDGQAPDSHAQLPHGGSMNRPCVCVCMPGCWPLLLLAHALPANKHATADHTRPPGLLLAPPPHTHTHTPAL
jgi:hypothetical protein